LYALQDPKLIALLALWHERRGARRFPARRDMSAFDFARLGLIGQIALIEVHHDPLRFRFRLMGTAVVERIGFDPTGQWLHDLKQEDYRAYIGRRVIEVLERQQPLADHHVVEVDGRAPRTSEMVRLPLAEDGEAIDRVLTCARFIDRREQPRSAPKP
jgi:hypothetical protein